MIRIRKAEWKDIDAIERFIMTFTTQKRMVQEDIVMRENNVYMLS